MSNKVIPFKDPNKAQRQTHTKVDTILITHELVKSWKHASFQRTLLVNAKVREVACKIRENDGVLPGILTLGIVGGDTYLVDGQHRCEAFLISQIKEGYADVRYHWFNDMAGMAQEFEELNSALVNWKPDDILRAREHYMEPLRDLRKRCPFIGYTQIRRGMGGPLISMSAVLRCWFGSEREAPGTSGSVRDTAERLTAEEAVSLAAFMELPFTAWGRDPEHYRLWGNLTLCLTMWLYRRTVMATYQPQTTRLTRDQFRRCLSALAADPRHLEFLVGRSLSETSRAPTYNRMKLVFAKRLEEEVGKTATGATKLRLPGPAWAHS